MHDKQTAGPESTAVRVALWRAMHVQVDPPPHVLDDEIGLKLAAPEEGWRRRPDMDPHFTSCFRASIVARARFIEDLVAEQAAAASPSTSFSAPASTRSPSAGRRSPHACGYSRSTSRARRPGSGGA